MKKSRARPNNRGFFFFVLFLTSCKKIHLICARNVKKRASMPCKGEENRQELRASSNIQTGRDEIELGLSPTPMMIKSSK